MRQSWIMPNNHLPISLQCHLAGVARSSHYAQSEPVETNPEDLILLRLIDEEYTRHPFYGSRRMRVYLKHQGYVVNRKRVKRLMRVLAISGMAPGPKTSTAHPKHKVYPYLLRGVTIMKPNQVWSTDITYIRLEHGFVYLVAIIDWYSRKVLGFRVSNTLDAGFCMDCLEDTIRLYGKPEIFNTDQGAQFTSQGFTQILLSNDITISMDGRGRVFDNIFIERLWRSLKWEDIYLKAYAAVPELLLGLTAYFSFYNTERPHQALEYKTPDAVYQTAQGGGALIIDKFNKTHTVATVKQGGEVPV
jgi:putative transposase